MGKGLPKQVVKIRKFCTSDITYQFSIPKYDTFQSFNRPSLVVMALFIFDQSGQIGESLIPTSVLKLIFISDIIK